jgi:hypothetical protein
MFEVVVDGPLCCGTGKGEGKAASWRGFTGGNGCFSGCFA